MNNNLGEIKNFTKSDIASIVFVIASVLNIIGSDKEKEYLYSHDISDKETAYNIYILVLLVLIVLYIYFIKANYQAYQNCNDQDRESYLVRLYGSIFFLVGGFCFLYYRIDNRNKIEDAVEI